VNFNGQSGILVQYLNFQTLKLEMPQLTGRWRSLNMSWSVMHRYRYTISFPISVYINLFLALFTTYYHLFSLIRHCPDLDRLLNFVTLVKLLKWYLAWFPMRLYEVCTITIVYAALESERAATAVHVITFNVHSSSPLMTRFDKSRIIFTALHLCRAVYKWAKCLSVWPSVRL